MKKPLLENKAGMAIETKNLPFEEIQRIGKLSSDGVFIYHYKEGRFLFYNAALVKILEINKKLLNEDPSLILKCFIEQDREYIKLQFAELLQREFLEEVQLRLVQNKYEKILSCSCYLTADKAKVIGFVKDISKPKQHEDYLINYGAKKDAILDMVSQRLSTPLNLSKFTVDLIEKAVREKKYDKLNSHIQIIREVTGDCIEFIGDFMKEEHMVSPGIHLKTNRFDALSKIFIVLEKLRESNSDKQFKIQTKSKHIFMNGDEVKFFQIIHNILSNAIKFTHPNGKIETIIKNYRSRLEVTIKDDGIGIPESLQPYIFDKNTRAARLGLKGEKSNGIGLYVSSKLTELLGGKITFESKENKGTKFTLVLPK
jgi:two-component system sensor histidine kinase VicK